ncbi:hypothetical protein [Pararobbsia silviterrae]|uniref:hypothetical protein n=1 Tax=Pararobbsia silviterrae TaxID=1792498 RepID=UPI0011C41082|nr:hypothetical protein [Pararobbsia silviterrae]
MKITSTSTSTTTDNTVSAATITKFAKLFPPEAPRTLVTQAYQTLADTAPKDRNDTFLKTGLARWLSDHHVDKIGSMVLSATAFFDSTSKTTDTK